MEVREKYKINNDEYVLNKIVDIRTLNNIELLREFVTMSYKPFILIYRRLETDKSTKYVTMVINNSNNYENYKQRIEQ